MTSRRGRKRQSPRPGLHNLGRKQRQARQARQKAQAHAQRIVAGRGVPVVERLSGAGADLAGTQEATAGRQAETQVLNRPRNKSLSHSAVRGLPRSSVRLLATLLLPGSIFVKMDRPAAGVACYALQASLVGWLPAVLWAAAATRDVASKQKRLAARLR